MVILGYDRGGRGGIRGGGTFNQRQGMDGVGFDGPNRGGYRGGNRGGRGGRAGGMRGSFSQGDHSQEKQVTNLTNLLTTRAQVVL